MRTAPQITVLGASDVLGSGLEGDLAHAARVLRAGRERLERRLDRSLAKRGYPARERKALMGVAPTALAAGAKAAGLSRAFLEQVEYNGRRLAKLNLDARRVLWALEECRRVCAESVPPLAAAERARFKASLDRWHFCVVLTLNNAFHQVADAEAQACHELFRQELESAGLDELLSRMLASLAAFCRAEAGQVFLMDGESGEWTLRASTGCEPRPGGLTPGARLPVAAPKALAAARCAIGARRPLRLPLDPNWRERFRTCWSVPLMRDGQLKGVIQFAFSRPYDWLPREVEVLTVAAERCLLAAAKARLTEQLAAREAQIRDLAGRVAQAEEKERKRISAELHDEAGQSLLCVRLQLEMLERALPGGLGHLRDGLRETRELTERTIVEIRRLVAALSPAVLDQLGLGRALRQLTSQLARLHGVEIHSDLGGLSEVPKPVALAAYRLSQECLHNAVRHSHASRINLSAAVADGQLRVCVKDDGIGFRVREGLARGGAFGLAGMSERASLLGGELRVDSRPRRGTRVSIRLPLRNNGGHNPLGGD